MESKIEEWIDEHFMYLHSLPDEEAILEITRTWGFGWYRDYAIEYYQKKVHEGLRDYHLFSNDLF